MGFYQISLSFKSSPEDTKLKELSLKNWLIIYDEITDTG